MKIKQMFLTMLGYRYVTRKQPKSFNEVHLITCRHGKKIKDKRYLRENKATDLIIYNDGKRHYDGCAQCLPELNTQEVKSHEPKPQTDENF